MKTHYSIYGNYFRMAGFIIASVYFILNYKDIFSVGNVLITTLILIGTFLELWLIPDVEINKDNLEVSRLLGLVKSKIAWNEIIISEKLGYLDRGDKKKYVKLVFKNKCLFERAVFILPFINNFNEIVAELKKLGHIELVDYSS